MRKIYLARHGEVQTGKKILLGQTDLLLSKQGELQASEMGVHLADSEVVFSRIYTSPLKRTLDTARLINEKLKTREKDAPLYEMENLKEIFLGPWDGKAVEEIMSLEKEEYTERGNDLLTHKIHGVSESFLELQERVIPCFLSILKESEGDILIVAHLGVNRVIMNYVMGEKPENLFQYSQRYGTYNIISYDPETDFYYNDVLC